MVEATADIAHYTQYTGWMSFFQNGFWLWDGKGYITSLKMLKVISGL